MLQLHRQNMRLGRLLTGFKHNNKDCIKIQLVARQTVKNALSDKKQLLKLALHSLIESWRADPTKFNSLIHGMSPVSTISKSTITNYAGSGNYYHATPFSSYYSHSSYTENIMEIIVNGAAGLYEKMVKDFTNETISNAAASTNSNLLLSMTHLDEQTYRFIQKEQNLCSTLNSTIIGQTINAVKKVYTFNETAIKMTSFPNGFTANQLILEYKQLSVYCYHYLSCAVGLINISLTFT